VLRRSTVTILLEFSWMGTNCRDSLSAPSSLYTMVARFTARSYTSSPGADSDANKRHRRLKNTMT